MCWSGLPCPPPGELPNPRIKHRSPTLQANSLPSEPAGKPKNTGMGHLSLLQGNFAIQGSNPGLLRCRQLLYQLSYQRRPQYNEVGFYSKRSGKLSESFMWDCRMIYFKFKEVALVAVWRINKGPPEWKQCLAVP